MWCLKICMADLKRNNVTIPSVPEGQDIGRMKYDDYPSSRRDEISIDINNLLIYWVHGTFCINK